MSPYIFWVLNYGGLLGFILFLLVALGFISQVVSITLNLNDEDPRATQQRKVCAACKKCETYITGTDDICPENDRNVTCEVRCDSQQDLSDCNKCDPIYRKVIEKYERARLFMGVGAGVAGLFAIVCLVLHIIRHV